MSFSYFDHEADIGIVGEADILERAFEEGAQALLNLIAKGTTIECERIMLEIEEQDLVALWIFFLNSILLEMDKRSIFFSKCIVKKITHTQGKCYLKAELIGAPEKSFLGKHEVKAATYCEAKVVNVENGWRVQCVVDI